MGIISKIFGTHSQHQIKKLVPTLDAIEALAPKYSAMSDSELKETTNTLKARIAAGETLDDILPDAYALVREAADRVLGKRPFRVQLLGGILLHQGRIAEMRTGEGKTLVATLPAYLNALSGNGVHIVTVNDYLARRDSEEMGRVYGFLGLTTGLVVPGISPNEKRKAYEADITYGTNNEFGFDYLRDNMVIYKKDMVQRGHAFAIVDEVDSILIDEARTPLIISGEGDKSTELYDLADNFVKSLKKFVIRELDDKISTDEAPDPANSDADYIVDEKAKNTILTQKGIEKAEKFFGLENYSDPQNATIVHHINQAMRAHGIMVRDVDYLVKDDQVLIVDAFTGRIMPGRRYNNGLHQAIEAKEHVKIQKESKTLATITFQNYFRMYGKLSGMTGTALTEEEEFREIYKLDVVEVPTNMPMIRIDHPDVVYRTKNGKYNAIVKQIKECHEKGQPVLVGTVSIEKSEELSRKLKQNGIPHTVLNAKYHEKEAEIVAQAGKEGAVTISTNMAGRGTDIMLGGNAEFLAKNEMRRRGIEEHLISAATGSADTQDEQILQARELFRELHNSYKKQIQPEADRVRAAGGLFILGTERHESRRIDNQLRGRSGRQGDPGESRFYLSFEDDLMRLFGSDRIIGVVERLGLDEDTPIDAAILSNQIEASQKRIEDKNFNIRKNVLTYDDVMNQQRNVIYKQRMDVLNGKNLRPDIEKMIHSSVQTAVASFMGGDTPEHWNLEGLREHFLGWLTTPDDFSDVSGLSAESVSEILTDRAMKRYEQQELIFGEDTLREIERIILLRSVDSHWMDHIDNMDELKSSIGLNAYAQRNPITEYRIVGADMFDEMIADICENTVRNLLCAVPAKQSMERVQVAKPTVASRAGEAPQKPVNTPVKKTESVGRNDPCPCGSGKKYKKCCGLKENNKD
jgi:preprotein translocase subunit SecA